MKNFSHLLSLILFVSIFIFNESDAQVAVTGSVSVNGNYATLSAAFTAINGVAQTGANITLTITANTTEPATGAVLNNGAWTSMMIQPNGSGRTISANVNPGLPLIDLNGADNVTIDPILGSLNFTFNNTSTSSTAGTSTIRFQSDAVNNKIRNCRIFGSATMAATVDGGTIWFAGNSVSTGNDNNLISNCNVGSVNSFTNLPSKCFYFSGTTTTANLNNSGDTIRNCNIYNYFSQSVSSAGVYVGAGTTNTIIKDNKFYLENTSFSVSTVQHSAIWISNTSGNNYLISGNTIGYSSLSGSGNYTIIGSSSFTFNAISLNTDPSIASNIQNNIIRNISASVINGTGFKAIFVNEGMVNITGNSIGNQTGSPSVSIDARNCDAVMIDAIGNGNINCSNNSIGGVVLNNHPDFLQNFYGIRASMSGSTTFTCQNNLIGGTVEYSISVTSARFDTHCYGIYTDKPAVNITGNTIRNMTSAGGNGTFRLASIIGIAVIAPSLNHTISQNLIFNIKNTNLTDATTVYGIFFDNSTGTNLVSRNFIHNNVVSNNSATLTGIFARGGNTTYQNNMISLGTDENGNGVNSGASMKCIEEISGNNNFYFNSLYVGGNPTSGSNNTFAISSESSGTRIYRNNIFYNARSNNGSTGKHYAVTIAQWSGFTMNNNIYFSTGTGAVLGLFNAIDRIDLANWKFATLQDAQSYQSDPKFLNPAGSATTLNLHIDPAVGTMVEGNGFDIVTITDDYDGQTRSTLTPVDIGADAGNFISITKPVIISGAVAVNGNYVNLAAAFAAINGAGQIGAAIIITVNYNTTEPSGGAVLNNGAWTSMKIIPQGGAAIIISGNITAGLPLIDFNGADKVTIDGLNSGGNSLTIRNTTVSSTAGTSTIRFKNDAISNLITRSSIQGSSTMQASTDGGTVWFGADAISSGNDNNSVSFCDIGPAGGNLPTTAVYSSGTTSSTPRNNSGDTISNCNIFDFFNSSAHSAGIYIGAGSTDLIISNNKFYQTSSRSLTTTNWHCPVWIESGNNYKISGNTIGFSSNAGTGTYTFTGISGSRFVPVYLAVGTVSQTNVNGNSISSIAVSGTMNGGGSNAPLACIHVAAGDVSIGTETGNTIGSMSSTGNITFTSGSSALCNIYGISNLGTGTWSTINNNIGGISTSNTGGGSSNIYGMVSTSPADWNCENNTIGGNVPNSLSNTSISTNTFIHAIANLSGAIICNNNLIRNITCADGSLGGSSSSIYGILSLTTEDQTISGNVIHTLTNTNPSTATVVTAIHYSAGNGANLIEKNLIYGLSINNNSGSLNGINLRAGTTSVQNNMISLGTTSSGAGVNKGCSITGIVEAPACTDEFYFNSVYVGGNPADGSANTFCINSSVLNNTRYYKDNIFYNARSNSGSTGKHYSILLGGTTVEPLGLDCNYNDLIANGNGGVLGFFNGSDQLNISAWIAATGQDSNSFESNPQFINPGGTPSGADLHINPSVGTIVEGNGFDISSIKDDFDGQERDTLTPVDIGADAGNFILLAKTFNLTMFIQGFYNSGSNAMVADTVRVYFRNGSSPYAIVDSSKANVSTSGTATFTVSNVTNGVPYYIQLKHRNSLETWSDSARSFVGNSLTFDFTTASSKAYGSNMPSIDSSPVRFGIYSGDVNQEGNVDLSDVILIYNDAGSFVTGYVKTDVNGDNVTDLSDIIITYNNASGFVVKETP